MESCFLSAFLFKALFRASLPHPTADRDYALYEIGEGCEVQYLIPGVDLLSDKYRCDGRTLLASLRWVAEELSRGRHNLMVSSTYPEMKSTTIYTIVLFYFSN